jgi:AbrB family looped-hinge helix DNA binding protein
MKIEELVKVDSKGRVTIPLAVREVLDIREGMYLLVVADKDKKELRLLPIPVASKLIKIRLVVEDRPGVLAELTRFLAQHNIDIVSTRCTVLKREELGECEMIVDLAKSEWTEPGMVADEMKKLEPVKNVEASYMSVE